MNRSRELIRCEVVILSAEEGGRSTPLHSAGYGGHYRPHIVLQSREIRHPCVEWRDGRRVSIDAYLGVALWDGPDPIPVGEPFGATLFLMYPELTACDVVLPGAEFTMREGGKIIGHGKVLERWTEETPEHSGQPNNQGT